MSGSTSAPRHRTDCRNGRRRLIAAVAVLVTAVAPSLVGLPASAAGIYDPFFANQSTVGDVSTFAPTGSTANRAFGVAAGDFTGDGKPDLFVGRVDGRVLLYAGTGTGTFSTPSAVLPWKQTTFNAWAMTSADVNGDGKLDVVWGANAQTTGCSVSPIPSGGTCATAGGVTVTVNDGEVRAFLGNGNGTFQETPYFVGGVRHNAGVLLSDVGTDAGNISAADIDGDGDTDLVAGAVEGVRLLTNNGGLSFTATTLDTSGVYFPATAGQNSPWGVAFGDGDGDGDQDLFLGDRALYVYLYKNNGSGAFSMQTGNAGVPDTRQNAYLDHDSYRPAVGFTPSLGSGDVNGDGRADLFVGLQSGTQTPASATAHDGEILLDVSGSGAHHLFGSLADVGTMARGVSVVDVNADGALDVVAGEYDGKVKLLRQLPPIDSDGDGVSDYVDNAPNRANAARIDMNTDGALNADDQLDNDNDTVRGNPEDPSTWQRLGDPADPDDDNDGVADASDNCAFTANAGQADKDGDGIGDACDPLFDSDVDGDHVPTFDPDDPLFARAKAAAIKWSRGSTHFVLRIDALGRLFQNEFTGLMTDAAISSPSSWSAKCQGMYTPGTDPDPGCSTLGGGKEVPLTTVVIPRLLWTDPEVITWINDRNDNPLFEVGQHGSYHVNNVPASDWKDMTDRNFFSCEPCGLSEAENYELMRVGYDTLLGNYGNKSLVESGATSSSPKIDWTDANPLISYAPPFNTSDTTGRQAIAQLGFKSFSASGFEEGESGTFGSIFTPEGSHHEQFDQFGMFHASADVEFDPIAVPDQSYDQADRDAFATHLAEETQPGGLNTWLIEEVEWSGRPCNEVPRLTTDQCNGGTNRENNTVYGPRWEQWLQLLDYVHDYPDSVAMTLGEVALAKAFDNAPTVPNPDQADADHDGIGDVIDGAALTAADTGLSRNHAGSLSATLANGSAPLAGQTVTFSFDADDDGTAETSTATTDSDGVASVSVTPTRPIGSATFGVSWDDGQDGSASDTGDVTIADATVTTLDSGLATSGQITDSVSVGATLLDSDGNPVAGQTMTFSIGTATGQGTTDADGHATAALSLVAPAGAQTLRASFAGAGNLGASDDPAAFSIVKEVSAVTLTQSAGSKGSKIIAAALRDDDGAVVTSRTITFETQDKVRGRTVTTTLGSAVTDGFGVARFTVASKYLSTTPRIITARFAGDASYLGTSSTISVSR